MPVRIVVRNSETSRRSVTPKPVFGSSVAAPKISGLGVGATVAAPAIAGVGVGLGMKGVSVPVPPPLTPPPPLEGAWVGIGVGVGVGFKLKLALSVTLPFMVTIQGVVLVEQVPPLPRVVDHELSKLEPVSGVAVRVTSVPSS